LPQFHTAGVISRAKEKVDEDTDKAVDDFIDRLAEILLLEVEE